MGRLSLLQGTIPTQGSSPGLPHCRWTLYRLSHKGSPRILEWVVYPFSSRSSQPVDQTHVSHIGRRLLNHEPPGKPLAYRRHLLIIALSHPITCLKGATSQQVRTIQSHVCCICKQGVQGRNPALLVGATDKASSRRLPE